jgi:hypothetical protein
MPSAKRVGCIFQIRSRALLFRGGGLVVSQISSASQKMGFFEKKIWLEIFFGWKFFLAGNFFWLEIFFG